MRKFQTLIFCTSHMADAEAWHGRYRRWLQHHAAIPWTDALLCLIDDGSPVLPPPQEVTSVSALAPLPPSPALPLLVRFPDRLGRPALLHYPGWWRSFLHSVVVARDYGCERIVHIESDSFVLSRRMAAFVQERRTGWTAFWCPRWRFPETCIQVICADQFDTMHRMLEGGWDRYAGQLAERVLPFTEVVREPHGNRYGEYRSRIPGFADFAAQVLPQHRVWFK
jgi:hypothetical protein